MVSSTQDVRNPKTPFARATLEANLTNGPK